MNLQVIIPAYNEEKTIKEVILGIKKHTDNVIIVDDCSKDKTAQIAIENGATAYRLIINREQGGAISTGIKAALISGADIIVTLDADGQHDPDEIPRIIKPIIDGKADAVIGSRFLIRQPMPLFRRMGGIFFNFAMFLFFGVRSTDSQSGMRAFSRKVAQSLEACTTQTRGILQVPPIMIREIQAQGFRLEEVPIKSIYTEYSLSKGQRFSPGLKALINLFIFKLLK